MINKELYRKAHNEGDLAMLLYQGVRFRTPSGNTLYYHADSEPPFRIKDDEDMGPDSDISLSSSWKHFADFEPIMPKPHWSDSASVENPIICCFWDDIKPLKFPYLGYLTSPYDGNRYYCDSSGHWEHAEQIIQPSGD